MNARNAPGSKWDLPGQPATQTVRTGSPGRRGPRPGRQPGTTAQAVVASLVLPAARPPSSQPVSPLPLAGLHRLPRDASLLYDIGRVDGSGRVVSTDIISALGWEPGTKLDVILTPRAIVIRAAPIGLFAVPRRPCILIPSHARRPHGIQPGDHVLIAAAPGHGLVLVYPLSALDDMITRYHSPGNEYPP